MRIRAGHTSGSRASSADLALPPRRPPCASCSAGRRQACRRAHRPLLTRVPAGAGTEHDRVDFFTVESSNPDGTCVTQQACQLPLAPNASTGSSPGAGEGTEVEPLELVAEVAPGVSRGVLGDPNKQQREPPEEDMRSDPLVFADVNGAQLEARLQVAPGPLDLEQHSPAENSKRPGRRHSRRSGKHIYETDAGDTGYCD